MGKQKKGKAQLKKAARIQATIREALIYAANKATPQTILSGSGSIIPEEALTFCCHGELYQMSICTNVDSLSKKEKIRIFKLVETNLKAEYDASQGQMPWNAAEKFKELFHSTSRLLLVNKLDYSQKIPETDHENSFAGFVHFRFEVDDEDDPKEAVLYLYEIQLTSATQRCGLGSHLMLLTELIARQFHMPKIMLTVFKTNISALKFYTRKLGYVVDPSSPSNFGDKSCTYEILSKVIPVCPPEELTLLSDQCAESARRSMPVQNMVGAAEEADFTVVVREDVGKVIDQKTESAQLIEEENLNTLAKTSLIDSQDENKSVDKVEVLEEIDEQSDLVEEEEEVLDGDEEEEEGVVDEGVNLLVEVTRVFFEQHQRMPTMEEIKDTLRTLQSQQLKEHDSTSLTSSNEALPIDLTSCPEN